MTGTGVNVIDEPGQPIGEGEVVTLTEGTTSGFTVCVMELLVMGLLVTQLNELVITQLITSLLRRGVGVYSGELVPAFTPFRFH